MKEVHLKIVKQYQYQKIQMLNYYTNLGKLKAFFKIMNVNKRQPEEIKDMFNE